MSPPMPGTAAARASNDARAPGSRPSGRCAARPSGARRRSRDEDQVVQSMPDASPTKWHRAHTTWFFEQFLLLPHLPGYRVFDQQFAYLFNSYYVAAGPRHARPQRGLVTRPANSEVAAYRAHVDAAVRAAVDEADEIAARRGAAHPRDRPQSRAAASGAAPHRHPARVFAESGRAGLRRRPDSAGAEEIRGRDLSRCRTASTASALPATATASTTKGPRTRPICGRCGSRARSSPMRSGSISSPTAATRRRRCGCRTAGRRCRRKAGRRPAIGARSTACRTR